MAAAMAYCHHAQYSSFGAPSSVRGSDDTPAQVINTTT